MSEITNEIQEENQKEDNKVVGFFKKLRENVAPTDVELEANTIAAKMIERYHIKEHNKLLRLIQKHLQQHAVDEYQRKLEELEIINIAKAELNK